MMMRKHTVTFVFFGLGLATLSGCPIYSDDRGSRICVNGNCYDCPDPYASESCMTWTCNSSWDCPSGYHCASDYQCHTSSSPPYADGGWDADGGSYADGGWDADGGSYADGGWDADGGSYADGGWDADGGSNPTPLCTNDNECDSAAGSKCLNGACVAPADQCQDDTQCANGTRCVQGACTPSTPGCDDNTPCPSGYACSDTGECVAVCVNGYCQ